MTTAAEQYQIELYEEHLEESSSLYEQRVVLTHDLELTWLDLGDYEARLEAHLDALFLGGDLALRVCRNQAIDGDAGELYAAVCVFCRHHRFDLLAETLPERDAEDEEVSQALGDALIHECPDDWIGKLVNLCESGLEALAPVAIRLIGWRRAGGHIAFLDRFRHAGPSSATLARAYGRLGHRPSVPWLDETSRSGDPLLAAEAVPALLRMGERRTVALLAGKIGSEEWALVPLGLCGSRAQARLLIEAARHSRPPGSTELLALGLLGDSAAVPLLLDCLDDKSAAEAAALALNLITGAELYEDVFIPDEVDEDELFEDELEKTKTDGVLTKPDGSPYGVEIHRLSRDPQSWRTWWHEHRDHFQETIRYRGGKPFSPACLIENLEAETCPNRIRDLARHELVIRYAADIPFELEMRVPDQKQAIARYKAWLAENPSRFKDGQWYFHGSVLHITGPN